MAKNHRRGRGDYFERKHQQRQFDVTVKGSIARGYDAPEGLRILHSRSENLRSSSIFREEMQAFSRQRFEEQLAREKQEEERTRDAVGASIASVFFDAVFYDPLERRGEDVANMPQPVFTSQTLRDYMREESRGLLPYGSFKANSVNFHYIEDVGSLARADKLLRCLVYPSDALRFMREGFRKELDFIEDICREGGVILSSDIRTEEEVDFVLNISRYRVNDSMNLSSFMAFMAYRLEASPYVMQRRIAAASANPKPRKVVLD